MNVCYVHLAMKCSGIGYLVYLETQYNGCGKQYMAETVAEEWLKQSGKQYMVEAVAEEWLKTWLNSTVCITWSQNSRTQ